MARAEQRSLERALRGLLSGKRHRFLVVFPSLNARRLEYYYL